MAFPYISLTSPYTSGAKVKIAQENLTINRFGDFHPGTIDGVYGPTTAAATKRAKYWLGYPYHEITATFGPRLHGYLQGSWLPITYQVRRRYRLRHQTKSIPQKALALATTQIGIKEYPPGSNRVVYTFWYGLIGPWCAMYVSWCYAHAGSRFRYSYVPSILSDANWQVNHLERISSPAPGDLVCFDWNGDGTPDHVGIFEKWITSGSFYSIEGNTGDGHTNGGEVLRQIRYTSEVEGYVRVLD